jgi:hypothetical protein
MASMLATCVEADGKKLSGGRQEQFHAEMYKGRGESPLPRQREDASVLIHIQRRIFTSATWAEK